MKVTIVVGGRWHAFDLARELNKDGHLHKIITNYPKWFVCKWNIPKDKITSLPLTFYVVRLIYKLGGEKLMMKCQWFVHSWFAKRVVRHLEGSELIHGWSQWSEPCLRWAKERGIKTVVERSSAHILEQSKLLTKEYRRLGLKWVETHPKIVEMELREYQLADRIAIPSTFVERSFEKYGIKGNKLFKNYLGVNLDTFQASGGMQKEPHMVGLKVIFAGTLSVRKGVHDLINGFRRAQIKDSKLILIGSMTPEAKYMLKHREKAIQTVGHLPQEELQAYYSQGHCFVIASIEEGMAMVQMQALACGLPLICSRNTGGEDLLKLSGVKPKNHKFDIDEYPAGFVVPIHAPDAIAYCLSLLNDKTGLWLNKRNSALNLALDELDWSSYGIRSIRNYQSLLKENK